MGFLESKLYDPMATLGKRVGEMTSIKQLYSLQELDLALDSIEKEKARAERELESRLSLGELEKGLEQERERLQEGQRQEPLQQLEVASLRERVAHLDGYLYSGASTNPRELEGLEQEAANIRSQADRLDERLVELSLRNEEGQSKIQSLEQKLLETRDIWESRQAELTAQVARLTTETEGLTSQRSELAAMLDRTELQKYERLRTSKGGTAIAKVERGLCQVCNLSLPSRHLQQVRVGRQTVLCNSCGRMLLLG